MATVVLSLTCSDTSLDVSQMKIFRLRARERFNELYAVKLQVACLGAAPGLDAIEGARLTVTMTDGTTTLRRWTGIVVAARERYEHGSGHHWYHLTLGPQASVARLVEKFDVRLNQSVADVLGSLLPDLGLVLGDDFELSLGSYAAREMIVQFRETDLAFLSRWCEHYGIYYYFADGTDGELQVFGDGPAGYRPVATDDSVAYAGSGDHVGVFELAARREISPGMFVCRDYNERTPAIELHATHELPAGMAFGGCIVDYGSHVKTATEADAIAAVRAGERQAQRTVYRGRSDQPTFAAGHTFTLTNHPAYNGGYLLVEVRHEAAQDVAGWGDAGSTGYTNRFTCIDAGLTYRPPRVTAMPRIHGLVSAIIETTQGDIRRDALIDNDGFYKVRFLFDHELGVRSCPVRMLQAHAGSGYGIHFPLKPGIEVAIAFLDGNPDRPMIVGAVPNTITPSPVTAASSTAHRIKSRSGILIELDDQTRGT